MRIKHYQITIRKIPNPTGCMYRVAFGFLHSRVYRICLWYVDGAHIMRWANMPTRKNALLYYILYTPAISHHIIRVVSFTQSYLHTLKYGFVEVGVCWGSTEIGNGQLGSRRWVVDVDYVGGRGRLA